MSGVLLRTSCFRTSGVIARLAIVWIAVVLVTVCVGQASAAPTATMTLQSAPAEGLGAQYGPLNVPMNLLFSGGTMAIYQSPNNTPVTVGTASLTYSIFVDTDPVVTNNIVLTNNTTTAQAYTLTVNLPLLGMDAISGSTVVGGSIDVDVRDNNGNGSTLGVIDTNTPIYSAFTNLGVTQALLLNMPPLVSGKYKTNNAAADFGTPIPGATGPVGTINNIGITLAFTLSARDTATFNSNFVIETLNIPEPASLTLIIAGGVMLLPRRRRV